MPTRKKPTKALVLELAKQAESLSARERQMLIALLRSQDTRIPGFDELEAAFKALGYYRLAYSLPQLANEIGNVCDVLHTTLQPVEARRQRHAVLCAVLQSATKHLLATNRPATPAALLRLLATTSWTELLDLSFPGYGIKLLGEMLCNPTLTSRASSLQTA